jgi:protein gp37
MNKSKIEWCDYTWNPITGCTNGCWYCYAKKIYERFNKDKFENVRFYPERLDRPFKAKLTKTIICNRMGKFLSKKDTFESPIKIFVCSMSDFFGKEVTEYMRGQIYSIIESNPQHIFQILTKQPQNINYFDLSHLDSLKNVWLGVTIETISRLKTYDLSGFSKFQGIKFVSYEPILGYINFLPNVDWIILGLLKNHKPEYCKQWINSIVKIKGTKKVFMKDSIKPYWDGELLKEFPNG